MKDTILKTLNKYSTTNLGWLEDFHGETVLLIDPMDYHKITDEIIFALQSEVKTTSGELYKKIYIKSESDLPKEDGRYLVYRTIYDPWDEYKILPFTISEDFVFIKDNKGS